MKLYLLIAIITLIAFLPKNVFASCPYNQYYVERIMDGDTIYVKNLGAVRVLGIDTYDKNKKIAQKQAKRTGYSMEKIKTKSIFGKHFAESKLLDKCIVLISDRKNKGYYGRYLRYIEVDGQDYQKMVLENKLGNVYCGDKKIKRFEEYQKLSQFKCK